MNKHKIATSSLVFGIISICYCTGCFAPLPAILAIILGIIAKNRIRKKPSMSGRNKANWGIGLGITSLIVFIYLFCLYIDTYNIVNN